MRGLVLLLALATFLVGTVEADAGKSRPSRASSHKRTKAKKPKLRADKGEIRRDRLPTRAKVATGEKRSHAKPGRRLDSSKLTNTEATAQAIEELLRTGPLRTGTTSLYVADAATGKTVFSVYPDDPLNPASNVKLIAMATALDILGPDHRYLTRVLGESPDDNGVIAHDVYLYGSYDATLVKANLVRMAQDLAASGVKQLDGDVVVGSTPTRDGMYRSFLDIKVTASTAGAPPTVVVEPATDFVEIVNTASTTSKKRVRQGISVGAKYVVDASGRKRIRLTITGQITVGKSTSRDVWLKERALHTAYFLRKAMRDAGIVVNGEVHIAELKDYLDTAFSQGYIPVPIAAHRSQRLAEIVARVNKRSTNWLSNRVLVTAAAKKYGGKPDMANGVKAMYAWLEQHTGLKKGQVVVENASGLSYKTELSARQLVTVLRAGLGYSDEATTERAEKIQEAYRDSLAIGGVDGTIKRRFKNVDGVVRGKTGTLSRVVSLAGVIEVSPDRKLVFSIITNGHDPSWKTKIRGGHERLVALLCQYLHKLPTETIEMPADPEPQVTVTITAGEPEEDEDLEAEGEEGEEPELDVVQPETQSPEPQTSEPG
jgi:D-alanyl-D-alanine carboxypeptidase/D-alanyl-D-alanine-endopeptidase (penicillin-binding protein 4)